MLRLKHNECSSEQELAGISCFATKMYLNIVICILCTYCLILYTVPTGEMVIMTELDLENHEGTPSKHNGVF